MGKSRQGKPKGGRPPQRRGKGGVGPGPGYKPNPNTGGSSHKSSFASPEMVKAVYITAAIPVLAILFVVGYFGYHAVVGA